jgi:hypothetical protein
METLPSRCSLKVAALSSLGLPCNVIISDILEISAWSVATEIMLENVKITLGWMLLR